MKYHTVNEIKYYKLNNIIDEYAAFKKGCKTNAESLKKRQVPKKDYCYARKDSESKWIESDGRSKKFDKIFISKKWFDTNYINKQDKLDEIIDNTENAPSIIKLKKSEKFHDDDNNVIEIEVRGERDVKKCYFKVEDVSKGFDMPNLQNIVVKMNTDYLENEHYKYFYCENKNYFLKERIKKLFLTYNGILKVLFTSKKGKTTKFLSWATETLFTAQLGSTDNKIKLAANIVGIDLASLNKFLSSTPLPLSCLYLIMIGRVGDLKDEYDLEEYDDKDDLILCKFGYTDDLMRRLNEHKRKYGNQIRLLIFNLIDPAYLSEAETRLGEYFVEVGYYVYLEIDGNNEKELVLINENSVKNIKQQYGLIGSKYEGKVSKQSELIKDLISNHDKEIMLKDKEIMKEKYEKELLMKDNKLALKDNEVLKQKIEIMELKNKLLST